MLLVRHGQSVWNADGRWQGHADPPLSALGQRQALAAVEAVGPVEVVVASDLARALQTATIVAAALGVGPVDIDPRLRETDAGEWTGLTRDEIEAAWPGWLAEGRRPPAFEPQAHVAERARHALADVQARHPGRRVLVVAHGGLIRAVQRSAGGEETWHANLGGCHLAVAPGPVVTLGAAVTLVDPDRVAVTAPPEL